MIPLLRDESQRASLTALGLCKAQQNWPGVGMEKPVARGLPGIVMSSNGAEDSELGMRGMALNGCECGKEHQTLTLKKTPQDVREKYCTCAAQVHGTEQTRPDHSYRGYWIIYRFYLLSTNTRSYQLRSSIYSANSFTRSRRRIIQFEILKRKLLNQKKLS